MRRRPLWLVLAGVALFAAAAVVPATLANAGTDADVAAPAPNPYGDPNLVSMFDGKTLDGWTQSKPGGWVVQNGAIHGTGAGRGWVYYNKAMVGTFRWIFNVRQVKGDHA